MRGCALSAYAERMALRCVIVDDSGSFVEAARSLLEREGMRVVGAATTTADAMQKVAQLDPDVVLVDVFLGSESGPELAQRLVRNGGPAVILISTHSEADVEPLIESAPVAGFMTKTELSVDGIRRIVASRSG
jgi:DNA-binding NarL/FixJ family response regulator